MGGSSWALGPRVSSAVEAAFSGMDGRRVPFPPYPHSHISHCSAREGGGGGGRRGRWRGKAHTGYLWKCQLGLQIGLFEKSLWSTSNMYVSLWLLEKALQSLLESLTCPPYTPTQHLEREQALAKEFAEILHFTLRFDELKVRPCVLGQFYRFILSTCMSRCFAGLWGGEKRWGK